MSDRDTTVMVLKERILALCREKGWGVDGMQNPQHMAMAMTVEVGEMLEHFQWLEPEQVTALTDGSDPKRVALIAEEFADVMIYGLQIMTALGVDVSEQIIRKLDIVRHRPPKGAKEEENHE